MNSSKTRGFIFVVVCIIVGIIVLNFSTKHPDSDCSETETFDRTLSKCVSKTSSKYTKEITETDEAKSKANTEKKRRNGTECIPASEAYNYIGVTGCVQLGVYTVNHTDYGYAWLDSEPSDSPTEFMVFAKNNVLTVADTNYYFGRIIQVRGTIEEYNGKAQIEITSKSAITDIESIQDRQTRTMQTITETQKQVNCENYKKFKQYCDSGRKEACSTANIYKNSCN